MSPTESRKLFLWIARDYGTPIAFLVMGNLRQCVKHNASFFAGRGRAKRLRATVHRIIESMGCIAA
jgi:hypothetical protein